MQRFVRQNRSAAVVRLFVDVQVSGTSRCSRPREPTSSMYGVCIDWHDPVTWHGVTATKRSSLRPGFWRTDATMRQQLPCSEPCVVFVLRHFIVRSPTLAPRSIRHCDASSRVEHGPNHAVSEHTP
jgi:hypothetical protein